MKAYREIRADYDRESIVVYQAYNDVIADAALAAGRFVAPFSFRRMTWIKPSFLWLMERSGWGTKPNQTRILAVRITRAGWDKALTHAVLTAFEPSSHGTIAAWQERFANAPIHVQWDPERSIHGKKQEHRAIQVGIGRTWIEDYVSDWIMELRDITHIAAAMLRHRQAGRYDAAERLLPQETVYPVADEIARRLGMT